LIINVFLCQNNLYVISNKINYFNPVLNIGLENIRTALYLLPFKESIPLSVSVYQGNLYYRLPVNGKRISYKTLKKGLVKKQFTIVLPLQLLPF
jgi:hypothetical protein